MDNEALQTTLDKAAKTVATITAIVGAFFTVNTGINAWRTAEVAKYTSFRQAVAAEETYWRTLYSDYLSAFEKESADRAELRRVKLFAVASLAEREIPGFEEHQVPQKLRDTARGRFQALKDSLLTAVRSPATSDPEVSRTLLASSFQADNVSPTGRGSAAAPAAAEFAAPPTTVREAARSVVSFQTQVLSTGRSNGWDVDVFWCQGATQDARYAEARATAMLLAGLASAGTELDSGVRLGRVRLRVLPSELQGTVQYPRLGPIVVREEAPGEPAAGAAVLSRIRVPGAPAYRVVRGMTRTPWYVSVFVCDAPGLNAAPPSPRPVAAS